MPTAAKLPLIVYGYNFSKWSKEVCEELAAHGCSFDFFPVEEEVWGPGREPSKELGLYICPTIVLTEGGNRYFIEGLDDIREFLEGIPRDREILKSNIINFAKRVDN